MDKYLGILFLFSIGLLTTICGIYAQYYVNNTKSASTLAKTVVNITLGVGVSVLTASLLQLFYTMKDCDITIKASAVWNTFIVLYGILMIVLGAIMINEAKDELKTIVGVSVVVLLQGIALLLFGGYNLVLKDRIKMKLF